MNFTQTVGFQSHQWVQWRISDDDRTCNACKARKNQVLPISDADQCPLHPNCRCWIDGVGILVAGEATNEGKNGADYWIMHKGILPEKYLTREEAQSLGWIRKRQNLAAQIAIASCNSFQKRNNQ